MISLPTGNQCIHGVGKNKLCEMCDKELKLSPRERFRHQMIKDTLMLRDQKIFVEFALEIYDAYIEDMRRFLQMYSQKKHGWHTKAAANILDKRNLLEKPR